MAIEQGWNFPCDGSPSEGGKSHGKRVAVRGYNRGGPIRSVAGEKSATASKKDGEATSAYAKGGHARKHGKGGDPAARDAEAGMQLGEKDGLGKDGMARGGGVPKKRRDHEKLAAGGPVAKAKGGRIAPMKMDPSPKPNGEPSQKLAKGGRAKRDGMKGHRDEEGDRSMGRRARGASAQGSAVAAREARRDERDSTLAEWDKAPKKEPAGKPRNYADGGSISAAGAGAPTSKPPSAGPSAAPIARRMPEASPQFKMRSLPTAKRAGLPRDSTVAPGWPERAES